MPKSLVIAEKPSVANDIARSLGGFETFDNFLESKDYLVTWAVGHILELKEPEDINPTYKSWKLEDLPIIPEQFELRPKQGQSKPLQTIKKLLKRPDVDRVVNACDAGREGELIFREIVQFLNADKPTQRLWLQSMTPDAIRAGFRDLRPGKEYDTLGDAAQCRSEADWLIGINATRALTRRMKLRTEHSAWSAGRVQTPTLALIVDRELEILKHRPEPFWRIKGRFAAQDHEYEGTWFDPSFKADPDSPRKDDWITDAEQLERIIREVRGKAGKARETRKTSSEIAPPLFDLTSLQREANRRMGFSARRTLAAAQRLYETHKLITYPRTDSRCLPEDYKGHVNQVLTNLSGRDGGEYRPYASTLLRAGLRNQGRNFDNSGVSDHFAIIPTTEVPHGHLSGDDERIYDLIVRRFLASWYPSATWMRVERITEVEGHAFRTRSRFLIEPGWHEVYGRDVEEDRALSPLQPGRAEPGETTGVGVRNVEADSESDETRPPARITEARLLTLMENAGKMVEDEDQAKAMHDKGLGTPATRAEIIENLVAKQYVVRAERALRATAKGILLIDLLRRIHIDRLTSPELTGEMEKHLNEVHEGLRKRSTFMDEVADYTREVIERAKGFDYDEIYRKEPPVGPCPLCKQRQVYERARFYACEGNVGKNEGPCAFSIWKERSGRYLDRTTVGELLNKGETPQLDGFLSMRGEGYKGQLRLTEMGTIELISERGERNGTGDAAERTAEEFPVNEEPLGACPIDDRCVVYETPTHYVCKGICVENNPKRKAGITLPRMVCKRALTREDAMEYIKTGRTPLIEDFISRYGRPFKASLVLKKESGRHTFEFPPREPRARKGAKAGAEGESEAPTRGRRGGASRKTAAKKSAAAAKKTTAKKTTAKKTTAKKTKTATAG